MRDRARLRPRRLPAEDGHRRRPGRPGPRGHRLRHRLRGVRRLPAVLRRRRPGGRRRAGRPGHRHGRQRPGRADRGQQGPRRPGRPVPRRVDGPHGPPAQRRQRPRPRRPPAGRRLRPRPGRHLPRDRVRGRRHQPRLDQLRHIENEECSQQQTARTRPGSPRSGRPAPTPRRSGSRPRATATPSSQRAASVRIRCCFCRLTASAGSPKASDVRVLTSQNTTSPPRRRTRSSSPSRQRQLRSTHLVAPLLVPGRDRLLATDPERPSSLRHGGGTCASDRARRPGGSPRC